MKYIITIVVYVMIIISFFFGEKTGQRDFTLPGQVNLMHPGQLSIIKQNGKNTATFVCLTD